MEIRPWPGLPDEDGWLIGEMERRLRDNTLSAVQLRARALELRAEAKQSDVQGVRDAVIALAERYEQTAVARLAA
jgi:hypothetical protein